MSSSTRPKGPPKHGWDVIDGWVLPREEQKQPKHMELIESIETLKPLRIEYSMEFYQGVFGEYRYWLRECAYSKMKKLSLEKCLDSESLMTRHLTVRDKVCAKNSADSIGHHLQADKVTVDKWNAVRDRGELVKAGKL